MSIECIYIYTIRYLIGYIIFMNKSLGIALAALLALGTIYLVAQESTTEYQLWKEKFGMKYSTTEDLYRQMIFAQNL